MMKLNKALTLIAYSSVLILSACSSTGAKHRPIVDGGELAHYETDLVQCQTLAQQRGYLNADTKTDIAIGAAAGVLAGIGDSKEDTIAGALVGALFGAASGSYKAKDEQKFIVIKCMQNRGYNVVEPTSSN